MKDILPPGGGHTAGDAASSVRPERGPLISVAMDRLLLASEQDDLTINFPFSSRQGCGVELRSGADHAAAKGLVRRGLGYVEGPGRSLPSMYWSNSAGLALRKALLSDGAATRQDDAKPDNGMNQNPSPTLAQKGRG